MKITLPEKPINGYTILFYSIELDRIQERRLVYHTNTPWAKFAPNGHITGVDITDQWMHYTDQNPTGRSDGWLAPTKWTWSHNHFATREEAIPALRQKLTQAIQILTEDLTNLQTKLSQLK